MLSHSAHPLKFLDLLAILALNCTISPAQCEMRKKSCPDGDSTTFDAAAELAAVRQRRAVSRRRRWTQHQLDPYRPALLDLRAAGASHADCVTWLRVRQRVTVDRSTVTRYLTRIAAEKTAAGAPGADGRPEGDEQAEVALSGPQSGLANGP